MKQKPSAHRAKPAPLAVTEHTFARREQAFRAYRDLHQSPTPDAWDQIITRVDENYRSWVHELVSNTVRNERRYGYYIDEASEVKKPSGRLRKILLLAVTQLLSMDEHPGIRSEWISAIRKLEGDPQARFATALLSRITRHRSALIALEPEPDDPVSLQAQLASLPEALWTRVVAQSGFETARKWAKLARSRHEPTPLAMSDEWMPKEQNKSFAELRPLLADGKIIIQDSGSQDYCRWVHSQLREILGVNQVTLLDLCAAPGGKAIHLAKLGVQVICTDWSESRAAHLRENIARVRPWLPPTASITPVDYAVVFEQNQTVQPISVIALDAPCSGTATLQKNLDLRLRDPLELLSSLLPLQRELIVKCLALCAREFSRRSAGLAPLASSPEEPPMVIAYSVCSWLHEEISDHWTHPDVLHAARNLKIQIRLVDREFVSPHLRGVLVQIERALPLDP